MSTQNYTWPPHVTVATVVERDGRFLLVEEEADGRVVINQPAGHLEAAETLLDAALRETREETGWQVELLGLVGVALYEAANGATYYRTSFYARPVREIPDAELDREIIQALWLTREQLQARAQDLRSPLVLATIDQYLAGHHYPLSLIYG